MNIQITRVAPGHPLVKGVRLITVDGKAWGKIKSDSRGSKGVVYSFYQIGGVMIMQHKRANFVCGAEKVYSWTAIGDLEAPRERADAIEAALRAQATIMIDDGRLRDPEVVKAEEQAKQDEIERKEQAEAAARRRRLENKADEVLAPFGASTPELRAAVADAMEWAQGVIL